MKTFKMFLEHTKCGTPDCCQECNSLEGVSESFNKIYPWKWIIKKDKIWVAKFNDVVVSIEIDPIGSSWDIKFDRDGSMAITGGGDQFGIFATVLDVIRDFINDVNPKVVTFSAEKVDLITKSNSRPKLYSTMVKKFANQFGYTFKEKSQYEDYLDYVLIKKKQTTDK